MDVDDLIARARAWMAADPDPDTRAELDELIAGRRFAALADRFAHPLAFGTAGLRGALGAGPDRMNRVVVMRAAVGLAGYLATRGQHAVVIGHDARHKSATFAADTAAVLTGAGLRAMMLPGPVPTPVLAFAVRHLGVDAGVMVTASHNPRTDNGVKVYLDDGAQIVPPADTEIAAGMADRSDPAGPSRAPGPPRAPGWTSLGPEVADAYIARAAGLVRAGGPRALRVAYTPLHGVGRDVLVEVFTRAGFAAPAVVEAQARPDPEFPTLSSPNPEDPRALELVLALAAETGADLVIANDPDADRCAVGVSAPGQSPRLLTGDEVGALLGLHLSSGSGRLERRGRTLATTLVSSEQLAGIAAAAGLAYRRTPTGFKWLARVPDLRYAYEEAMGYCVDPDAVRDKDGITAALLIAELAADARARGCTLVDLLDELARRHGVHLTGRLSVPAADEAAAATALRRLRRRVPGERIGGHPVHTAHELPGGGVGITAGPADGVAAARVFARPSGTEPKLKVYLEVVVDPDGAARLEPARAAADRAMTRLLAEVAADLGVDSG